MPIEIQLKDMTEIPCKVIVNESCRYLEPETGLTRHVYYKADYKKVRLACGELPQIPMGSVTVTPSYNLNCKYLFHAVAPLIYCGDDKDHSIKQDEIELLKDVILNHWT